MIDRMLSPKSKLIDYTLSNGRPPSVIDAAFVVIGKVAAFLAPPPITSLSKTPDRR